jgi:hypothetical protein
MLVCHNEKYVSVINKQPIEEVDYVASHFILVGTMGHLPQEWDN